MPPPRGADPAARITNERTSGLVDVVFDEDGPGGLGAIRINVRGIDLSMLQPVWAMQVFPPSTLRFGHRYVDMVETIDDVPTMQLSQIDQTEPERP